MALNVVFIRCLQAMIWLLCSNLSMLSEKNKLEKTEGYGCQKDRFDLFLGMQQMLPKRVKMTSIFASYNLKCLYEYRADLYRMPCIGCLLHHQQRRSSYY